MKKTTQFYSKVFFTLFVLLVNIALTNIPVLGLNSDFFSSLFQSTSMFGFMDMLSGGSMSQLGISGFGISSYISASIIIQLLGVLLPRIEKVSRNGYHGKEFIQKANFILALAITLSGSIALAISCGKMGLYIHYTPAYVALSIICWFLGSFIVIFLALKVEDYGIGNGISLILTVNILSRIPGQIWNTYASISGSSNKYVLVAIIAVMIFLLYLAATYLQSGKLNVPIKQNRKQTSIYNSDDVLPIPVNIANVLPVVYAASIISLPVMAVSLLNIDTNGIMDKIISALTSANWYSPTSWYHIAGFLLYLALIVLFGFFCSQLSFNSAEIADNMRKNGDVIKGVTPGDATIRYLEKRRFVMTVVNLMFLFLIAVVPDAICARLGLTQLNFLGTSMIIVTNTINDLFLRMRAATVYKKDKYRLFIGKRRKNYVEEA